MTGPSFATAPAADCTAVAVLHPNGSLRSYAGASAGDALLVPLLRLSPVGLPRKNEPEIVDPDPDTSSLTAGPGAGIDQVVHYEGVRGPAGEDDDHGTP